jgi:uncharacterized OB-fold protein
MTPGPTNLAQAAPRILPELTDLNRPFWTGGRTGHLLIQRCVECRRWTHPPTEQCPSCQVPLHFEPVSGKARIFTYTVNYQQFHPDVPPPYVIALVVLDEQDDLRIPTNIVHADHSAIACDAPVRVIFEQQGEVFVPVFELVD